MGFPTSDMLAAAGNFFMHQALGERFRTRHPDLADRLQTPNEPALYLSVPLTRGQSVALAQVRFDKPYDHTPVWAVVGPGISKPPRIWWGLTDTDVLVDALHARAVAELEHDEEQSPWRWDEPETGEIVALADELAARGAEVLMAVAQNRCRAVKVERGTKAEYFGSDRGDFLLVQGLGCLIRVSHKPLSGWIADVRADAGRAWQRLDLGGLLLGEPSVVPGVERGRVDRAKLAGLVVDLARLPRVPTVEARPEPSTPVEEAVHELAKMGFADVVPDSAGTRLESETFRIEWWKRSKSLGLGDMQRLFGVAAMEGRRLMVLSESSATRPALAFADQAKAFVFAIDPGSRRPYACNDLAREVVIDKASWAPARGPLDR